MLKEIGSVAEMQAANYSKVESEQRGISIESLDKIAYFFGMTIDQVIHFEDAKIFLPTKVGNITANEKVKLISKLNEEDKHAVYPIMTECVLKINFKRFFEQNIQNGK